MTPREQLRADAIDAYARLGSIKAAADDVGIPAATVRGWLDKAGVLNITPLRQTYRATNHDISSLTIVRRDPCRVCGVRGDVPHQHRKRA